MVLSPLTITRTSLLPAARCAVLVLTPAAAPLSAGASANLNIAHGSSDYCGGILTIFGGPSTSTAGFTSPTWPAGLGTEPTCTTTHQQWVAPGAAVPDPFAFISPPSTTGLALNPAPITV